jgi:hypothetical protein
MPIIVPIVSEFDGKGLSRAIKEFEQLETTGEKAQFALKKAALPAAAAMGALAVGIGAATQAAAEDAAAQDKLAGVLERTTGATEAQVAANEQFITSLSMAAAISDDQLRPAMAALAQVTGDVQVSQQLLTQATDIAAATGTELTTVTDALAKAYAGNMKGLQALAPELRDNIKEGQTFEQVMAVLSETMGGAATRAADTATGQMARLKITLDETKESIGAAFLPILEDLLPRLQSLAEFVQRNTKFVTAMAVAIGSLAAVILTANAALKVYNATLVVVEISTALLTKTTIGMGIASQGMATRLGIAGLAVTALGVTISNLTADGGFAFRELANVAVRGANLIIDAFEAVANSVVIATNAINKAVNAILPGNPIPMLPKVTIPSVPSISIPSPSTPADRTPTPLPPPVVPNLPAPSPIAPAPSTGGGGGGAAGRAGGGGAGGGDFSITPFPQPLPPDLPPGMIGRPEDLLRGGNINVTVNTVTAPEGLGQEIVDALRYYNRANGPIDILIAQ